MYVCLITYTHRWVSIKQSIQTLCTLQMYLQYRHFASEASDKFWNDGECVIWLSDMLFLVVRFEYIIRNNIVLNTICCDLMHGIHNKHTCGSLPLYLKLQAQCWRMISIWVQSIQSHSYTKLPFDLGKLSWLNGKCLIFFFFGTLYMCWVIKHVE